MKIFYCGDIVGRAGREAALKNIPVLKKEKSLDVVLANAENAAHGFGLTPGICRDLFQAGVDAILTGNHIWDQREILPYLDELKNVVRPLNYPPSTLGHGFYVMELPNGKKLVITQVLGRVFMESADCPVQALEKLLSTYHLSADTVIFVDIHAEATAEKLSLGFYLDGRVSAVAGTHTHVQTADERVLPKGTAYITDVGMCGVENSVLGFDPKAPIERLKRHYPYERLTPASGEGVLRGIIIETDDKTGLALHIERVRCG